MAITIVGLGPGSISALTIAALEALRSGRPVLLRTAIHPTVDALKAMGIQFESCDDLYEKASTFEEVYAAIADRVLHYGDVVFAVPGHPMVGERSVRMIQSRAEVEVIAGPSCLDAILSRLCLDPIEGLEICDGMQLERQIPSGNVSAIIMQLHDRSIASQAKLALMERYPDDHMVTLIRAAGISGQERVLVSPLCELDHHDWVDYLTTLYLPPLKRSGPGDIDPRHWTPVRWPLDPLVEIMDRLRGAQGCPWDREQTHLTLRRYMLEEAYEVVEAVDSGNAEALCEELGDVLLQVVFHAQMARECGTFDMHDIVREITSKLVRRHPHVFGGIEVNSAEEVARNWEAIKRREKVGGQGASLSKEVSRSLPALSRAFEIQRRAAKVGVDWDDAQGPALKVMEELNEVLSAAADQVESEVGDLLFAVVNLSRKLAVDPEIALTGAVRKFISRFEYMERRATEKGVLLSVMTVHEMERLWNEAKESEQRRFQTEKD